MKKIVKILLVVLLFIIIAATAFSVWQWKNIKSIYVGINESPEEITRRQNENQTELAENIGEYIDGDIREFTEEEKEKIASGEMTVQEVYLQIFSDMQSGEAISDGSDEKSSSKETESAVIPTKDEIVAKYMTQFYNLQSKYTAMAEATIADGKKYYKQLRKTESSANARANTIAHFTPIVRGVEASCDAEFESLLNGLKSELSAIGENTDIERTIRNTYNNEKQLKLSYYANKYLK